jgi:hypothetical protein
MKKTSNVPAFCSAYYVSQRGKICYDRSIAIRIGSIFVLAVADGNGNENSDRISELAINYLLENAESLYDQFIESYNRSDSVRIERQIVRSFFSNLAMEVRQRLNALGVQPGLAAASMGFAIVGPQVTLTGSLGNVKVYVRTYDHRTYTVCGNRGCASSGESYNLVLERNSDYSESQVFLRQAVATIAIVSDGCRRLIEPEGTFNIHLREAAYGKLSPWELARMCSMHISNRSRPFNDAAFAFFLESEAGNYN